MHDDPVYRPQQCWAYLGVSKTTFFKLISEGKLPPPARLAPRAIGYRRSVLDAFIRGCEVAA